MSSDLRRSGRASARLEEGRNTFATYDGTARRRSHVMSNNADLHRRRQAASTSGMSTMLPVYVERASNAELWEADGRRYIDFAGGIAVVNTGHLHPQVKAAVAKQLEAFTHTCV